MRELGRRTEAARPVFQSAPESRAFYPQRSQASDLPLVTVHSSGQRVTIAASCPIAQSLGLAKGMALTQARILVSDLLIRDADPDGDLALLTRLALFAARRWTPRAALSGPDGLWLDVTGVCHLFGGEERMCARILHFCARLDLGARIALADTIGAAHALARYGGQSLLICPSGAQADAIAGLPIAALRVDEEIERTARRLGIERIGELIAMPRAPLGRRFGAMFLNRLDQALGRAPEAVTPIIPSQAPNALHRFAEPIATAEAIAQAIGNLLAELVDTLEKTGLAARSLTLCCARIDGAEQRVAVGTARATRDAAHLSSLLCARIETIEPGFGIEAMRLVAERCEPLAPIMIAGGLSGTKPVPDLVPLIDRLANRLGSKRLFRLSAVESDVPERSICRVTPLDQTISWPSRWPRPVRLLSRPERVDKVVALLPDGPPRRFSWRGAVHVIRRADGPERIYGEWWKASKESDAVRDYFQVEDEAGARYWIFRRGDGIDNRTGDLSWYLHGVFG